MKRLEPAFSEVYELDVIECDCGFHIGLDNTYIDQVNDIKIECPACSKMINTDFDDEIIEEESIGYEWVPYNFNYEKKWYDIELDTGDIINQCYPNAGYFHSGNFGMFREERVKRIRRCAHPLDNSFSSFEY